MDFLNHREGEYGFLSGFPLFSFKRLREFEEIKIQQSCRGDFYE
jgi:hypothetical protein